MAATKYNLERAKELWRQEPNDNAVFKAEIEDIEEYPPEIQNVIREEAERRRKLIEAAKELHGKPKWFDYTYDGVFGFLFFMGAAIMGASLPIRALMLAVGIVVGHFVKEVAKGLKEKKNISSDENPKDEQR
ncbi:hypothetical protein ES703_26910 [subsurface metagenome]